MNLETLQMEEGDLPDRAMAMIREWASKHRDELLEVWKTQQFRKIEPLA